jgi:hypothetical protein
MANVLNNLFGGKSSASPDPTQVGGDPGKLTQGPAHLTSPPSRAP